MDDFDPRLDGLVDLRAALDDKLTARIGATLSDRPDPHTKDAIAFEAALVDLIEANEMRQRALAAESAVLAARLHAARLEREEAERVAKRRRGRGLGAEVGRARHESPKRGREHLELGIVLSHYMPYTLAALHAGRTHEAAVMQVVHDVRHLSPDLLMELDRQLAADIDRNPGDRQLRAAARRHAARLDPEGTRQRDREAADDRHVRLRTVAHGMAWLSTLMPMTDAVASYDALEREAASARAAGDERTRGQVMADTMLERVTGKRPAAPADVEVELVMTDGALFGSSDEPAELVGGGAIPAEVARRMVAKADKAWVRRLFTDPDTGELVAMDSRRRLFSGQLRHLLLLPDRTCANAWCDARVRHADHVKPARDGGPTSVDNGNGLCEDCSYTKELPGWRATLIRTPGGGRILDIRTPTGHHGRSGRPPLPGGPDPTRPRVIWDGPLVRAG